MAKRKGIFKKLKKGVSRIVGKRPKDQGGDMPLAPVLAAVGRAATRFAPAALSALRRSTKGVAAPGGGLPSGGFFGVRRRKRGALTVSEMGKITFLAQTLGKRNPAVTLIVMKALGGKL